MKAMIKMKLFMEKQKTKPPPRRVQQEDNVILSVQEMQDMYATTASLRAI